MEYIPSIHEDSYLPSALNKVSVIMNTYNLRTLRVELQPKVILDQILFTVTMICPKYFQHKKYQLSKTPKHQHHVLLTWILTWISIMVSQWSRITQCI